MPVLQKENFIAEDGQRAFGDFAYVEYHNLNADVLATLVHLPEIGIKGNSHFLMQEKNNEEILKLALAWLKKKGLDK